MSNSNKIFNVDEEKHSALETTAPEAQAAAVAETMGKEFTEPLTATDKLQRNVSKTTNAVISEGKKGVDHVKAVGAGYVEQVMGKKYTGEPATITDELHKDVSKTTNAAISEGKKNVDHVKAEGAEYADQAMTATDKLQKDVSKTTNAAVSEGEKDVNHVKAVGAGYAEQAMAATDKLQRDVSKTTNAAVSEGEKDVNHVKAVGAGYVKQVQDLARSAIDTAQTYLPESIANQLPNVSEGDAESQPSSGNIPTTSALLERSTHRTFNSPYSTTTKKGTDVGANEAAQRIHN